MQKTHVSVLAMLLLLASAAIAQNNSNSTTAATADKPKANANNSNATRRRRGPVFRASKDQIKQAQGLLKQRGLYAGEQTGKLDDATRDGLRKFQQAEGVKVTGTLNAATLEKMSIALTDKQREIKTRMEAAAARANANSR